MARIDATVELGHHRALAGQQHRRQRRTTSTSTTSSSRSSRVDGDPPPPELAGWKDTVFLPADSEVELLVRFADYADPDTPYMFHCHLLRHEDQGMMGQFVVVEPGDEAGDIDDIDDLEGMDHAGHTGH